MKPEIAVALVAFAVGWGVAPTMAQTIPVVDLSQAGTRVVINDTPGDQYDPHLDPFGGDLVSYSNIPNFDEEVRYYRFSTGLDAAIPPCASPLYCRDLLGDVAGGAIAFTRVDASYLGNNRVAVALFDTTMPNATPLEIDPQPAGSRRWSGSIGRTAIAFVDVTLAGLPGDPGELMVFDRTTAGPPLRLTNDAVADSSPALSPNGDVVVWQRCTGTPSSPWPCDIGQAVRQASGTWILSTVATDFTYNYPYLYGPATNGTLVVYERADPASPTGRDIFYRPVAGGPEVRLPLPGDEFAPEISGSIISFAHQEPTEYSWDIYLFDVSTGRAYRITDTPAFNETLNDVGVLPNGDVRVVWQTNDEDGVLNNLYGTTVTLYDLDTVITSSPPAATNSTLATFTFAAADPAAQPFVTFECALEGGAFSPCTSPKTYVALSEDIHAFSVRVKSRGGAVDPTPAEYKWTVDLTPPLISIFTPSQGASYLLKSTVAADYDCAEALSRVAFCDAPVAPGYPIDTSTVGTHSFVVNAADTAGNAATAAVVYGVAWDFNGFFPPLRNAPALNVVKAGRVVPVAFSLGGDFGLSLFAGGYPVSVQVDCDALGRADPKTLAATLTPAGPGLKYDPSLDTYTYPWKTVPKWAGTCRQLVVRLVDGTEHYAYLQFR